MSALVDLCDVTASNFMMKMKFSIKWVLIFVLGWMTSCWIHDTIVHFVLSVVIYRLCVCLNTIVRLAVVYLVNRVCLPLFAGHVCGLDRFFFDKKKMWRGSKTVVYMYRYDV